MWLVQVALSHVLDAGLSHPSILVGTRKQRRAPREQELLGEAMCTKGANCRGRIKSLMQ